MCVGVERETGKKKARVGVFAIEKAAKRAGCCERLHHSEPQRA